MNKKIAWQKWAIKHIALLVLVPVLVVTLIFPSRVFAGIFSVFKELFAAEDKKAVYVANSQTLALLEPVKTASPSTGGAEIVIVDGSALTPDTMFSGSGEVFKPKNDQISIYEVRKGDTLSSIAEMFDVSTKTIMWANDMTTQTVRPGDTLVILPVSGVRHTVKRGDTISTIAKLYKGDAQEIADFNQIDLKATLKIGQQIIIPDGEITIAPKATAKPSGVASVSSAPAYDGFFLRPLSGGRRTQGIHGFNAVDIAAPEGTAVYASASGKVLVSRSAGWNGGYGSYIVIAHNNGTQTLYAHLSQVYVGAGETVSQGDTIGAVGNTGKSSGAHLHFEVRGAKNPF